MSDEDPDNLPQEDEDMFDDEDEENLAFLPADHPLLQPLQAALTKQQQDEHERVDLELIKNEDDLKKLERKKEDIGVQLYGVQQQLAQLQMTFEETLENFNLINRLRVEAEEKLEILKEKHEQKKLETNELQKRQLNTSDELTKLNRILQQIQNYNQQMKKAIGVTKRTTYRAEQNVTELEKDQKKQDFLIDQMNEEIKRLNEQREILRAQHLAQEEETRQAKHILKEAQLEMDKIIISKNEILVKWQKCLMDIKDRDQKLEVMKDALEKQREFNITLQTELRGVKKEKRAEAFQNENLRQNMLQKQRVESVLKNESRKVEHEQTKFEEQLNILKQSFGHTEDKINQTDREQMEIERQILIINTNTMDLHTEIKQLHGQYLDKISLHIQFDKNTKGHFKQAMEIRQAIENRENDLETLINEKARVDIDTLNTHSEITRLKKKFQDVLKESQDKKDTVKTYEVEIRQGHEINSQKQHQVAQLNREKDDLLKKQQQGTSSTLQQKIQSYEKEIQQEEEVIQQKRTKWIFEQTQLVDLAKEKSKKEVQLQALSTEQVILEQKKLRLGSQYNEHEKQIKKVQIQLKDQNHEMKRLNNLLSKNDGMRTKLTNEYYNIQSDFVEKLKELETESVNLEVEIDRLKEEKAELLAGIVECERQILLWERKIQLEKEMQETLDPTIGHSEINERKKEIHIMELRLKELQKKQEDLIHEIEQAVFKRESIQLKYSNKEKVNKYKGGGASKPKIKRHIQTLKKTLQQTLQKTRKHDKILEEKNKQYIRLEENIAEEQGQLTLYEGDLQDAMNSLSEKKIYRLKNIYDIAKIQTQARKYDDILNSKAKLSYNKATLSTKLIEQSDLNSRIQDTIVKLKEDYGQYALLLDLLLEMDQ